MGGDHSIRQLRYMGVLAAGLLTPAVAGATVTAAVARHSGKCVDVPGAATHSGVGLQQYTCNSSPSQAFDFIARSDGFHQITAGTNASLCLDAGTTANARVTQTTCSTTSDSQKWLVSKLSDGTYQVKTRSGAACLNISGGSTADGATLITSTCGTASNMRFALPDFAPPPPYSSKVTTLVPSHSNKCLKVSGASTAPGANLQQWACDGAAPQSFQLAATSDGYYQVKPRNSGLCLDSGAGTDNTPVLQQSCGTANSQKWKVVRDASGAFTLSTVSGTQCLAIYAGSSSEGENAVIWKCSGSPSQSFYAPGLIGVSGPPNGDPLNPPATVTANGNFQLHAGRIYDPTGKLFVPMGFNVWPDAGQGRFDNLVTCWKSNIVRLNHVHFDYGGWYSQARLEETLAYYASRGIVAMVEWHEVGQIGDELEGSNDVKKWPYASSQAHTNAIKNFHVALAQKFKNNPYVWFNLINEPGGEPYEANHSGDPAYSTVPRWVNVNRQLIEAIRATGAQNMIVIDGMTWGQDSADGAATRVTERDSAILKGGPESMVDAYGRPYGNVMFSVHTYGRWRNYPAQRLEQYFKDVRAKGMAIMVGEYNNDTAGVATGMVTAAQRQGVGRLVWHHDAGDTGLTTTGTFRGWEINSCTNPTNLNPLGKIAWDDMHR